MKRKDALAALRIAGYHDDERTWVRVFVESRISQAVAKDAWAAGQQQRAAGLRCTCHECCKRASATA